MKKARSQTTGIYRSVVEPPNPTPTLVRPNGLPRPPRNVPYVVDNLWEWKRPQGYPSRRYATFASPQPVLAKEAGPKGGTPCSVQLNGRYTLCQLIGWRDARHHPDCDFLRRFLIDKLGQKWVASGMGEKTEVGRLWMPCLEKADMNHLFDTVGSLKEFSADLYDAIGYWDTIVLIDSAERIPDAEGELFFEARDGYYLTPLSRPAPVLAHPRSRSARSRGSTPGRRKAQRMSEVG